MLKQYQNICIGMHSILTSEWDGIRWKALSESGRNAAFTDEKGYFFHSAEELTKIELDIDAVLKEYNEQLDLLTRLGLKISYIDSHMAPELFLPELLPAFREWINSKGLIDAIDFYSMPEQKAPEFPMQTEAFLDSVEKWIGTFKNGNQYFYITHPAADSDEMLLFYNASFPSGIIRRERNLEYCLMTSERWKEWQGKYDLQFVKYTEAVKQVNGLEMYRKLLGV